MTDPDVPRPLAYFLTFRCYGTWLHGDQRGSVDQHTKQYGAPQLPRSALREQRERSRMAGEPVQLAVAEREVVHAAIAEVCRHRGWELHAANARATHVHVVVSGDHSAKRILKDLKARATRLLVESGHRTAGASPWGDHGSTRYLWNTASVERAIQYVLECQDEPRE